jgi:hypothetical protein
VVEFAVTTHGFNLSPVAGIPQAQAHSEMLSFMLVEIEHRWFFAAMQKTAVWVNTSRKTLQFIPQSFLL